MLLKKSSSRICAFKTKLVNADKQQPILGLNFFHDNNLSINVRDRKLIDENTKFNSILNVSSVSCPNISVVNELPSELLNVLSNNSNVFDINCKRNIPDVIFKIETSSAPKPSRSYRLSPDKLKAARLEVENEIK